MSESGNARPTAAKLYQSPASEGPHASAPYTAPGVPAPRQVVGEQYSGQPHQAPERNQDQRGGGGTTGRVPDVGDRVTHRTSGQMGTVVGHHRDAHAPGRVTPQVQWKGEEASWPQGVSANALRIEGSEPNDLYRYNQDATSGPPLNRQTGAL